MKEEDLMTARDHFALAAMVGLILDPEVPSCPYDVAEEAYSYAYHMMKQKRLGDNESN
jgi:hypothetical protein